MVYFNPVKTTIGNGCFKTFINDEMNCRSFNDILLFSGNKGIKRYNGEIQAALEGKRYVWIKDIKPTPSFDHIYDYYRKIEWARFKYIIAIGGGSVLDTAKILKAIINAKIRSSMQLKEMVETGSYKENDAKLILIPTTAGTGSEKTKWATLWDPEGEKKYSVEHDMLYAHEAYIDPELTYNAPVSLAVTFALDSLSHAVEAFWSTKSLAVTREYSLTAVRLFRDNFDKLLNESDTECRDNLMLASLMAANAFSHTKTTICHAISYSLTLKYEIPHGIAASMTLPYFLNINSGYFKDELTLLNYLGIDTWTLLRDRIISVLERAGVCYKLSQYGVCEKNLEDIADRAFVKGRFDNNPVRVDKNTIVEVLLSCM